jgi:hypothetical protein
MKRNIFIVMCMSTCILFTVQCGNDDRTDVPPEILGGIEELPGELERVECPSPAKTGEEYDLVGEWKLILQINETDTVDCSCEDVVYHFKPDQTLTVSTGDGTVEEVAYEYDWGFPFCPACFPHNPRPNLRMGSSEVYCWALDKKMLVYPQFEELYTIEDPDEGPSSMELGAIVPLFEIKWLFVRID